jgi:hypothetical protein
MRRPVRTTLLFLVAISCRPTADARQGTDSVALSPRTADNRFDPATVRRGDTVGALVLDSIERQQTPSGEWVGRAWFSGTVSLTGETFRHPDGADYPYPCFEADTSSASRLPRWSGDSRRAWFCFENASDAKARLGDAVGIRKSIVVDRFTIHRNLSDAVNSSRLVDLEPGSLTTLECFSTPESILARRPGSVAAGPPGLTGSIRLSGVEGAESLLADSDGRSLGATWRRIAGDSMVVIGRDDFLRIELRVARTARGLSGTAVAYSDAATEPDSSGQAAPFRRQWALEATRARC